MQKAKLLSPVVENDKEKAKALLGAGNDWNCRGWNTSIAARKLWNSLKVPLVSNDAKDYLHAWLFGLSLAWGVEIPDLALSDRASQAAFLFMEAVQGVGEPYSDNRGANDGEEDPQQDPMKLDWEEDVVELPRELSYLWNKAKAGERLELREVLQEVPKMRELPRQAPGNKHRDSDGRCSAGGIQKRGSCKIAGLSGRIRYRTQSMSPSSSDSMVCFE